MSNGDTFPRQYARTQRLTLGEPRNVTVSADGTRVLFLRSNDGADPVHSLWSLDVAAGRETLLIDARSMNGDGELPPEERARRERLREGAGGITSYATNAEFTCVVFSIAGRLHVATIDGEISTSEIPLPHAVFDARPRPQSSEISYVFGGGVWITDYSGNTRRVTTDEGDEVTWGMADFVAAEEMGRHQGYWWSPDGSRLALCRVDNSPLRTAWIGDAANPESAPVAHKYPFAGTPNARVEVHVFDTASGITRPTTIGTSDEFEYVSSVQWRDDNALVVGLLSRDQCNYELHEVRNDTVSIIWRDTDHAWVELVPGSPCFTHDDKLVVAADRDGRRCLIVGGETATHPPVQVRSIIGTNQTGIYFAGNEIADATQMHIYRVAGRTVERITEHDGVNTARIGGDTVVIRTATMHEPRSSTRVRGGAEIENLAEIPLLVPNVTLHTVSNRAIHAALVLPVNYSGGALPVLCDPYGGPHAQRVVSAQSAYLSAQWFAEQGFAVVIADGRGTPGRGSKWERDVHKDVAGPVLEDQVAALQALAESTGALDLTRVAIRGWSFGGYLAALAVMRRPDVFHCGIAGAPVTDWALYDTCYTERYLGNPAIDYAPYAATSLIPDAAKLERPLLMIHGLADDNVLPAHTLQLSNALLASGKTHEVLPLSGVSHMTPQEVVAENLLLHQLEFLRRSLRL